MRPKDPAQTADELLKLDPDVACFIAAIGCLGLVVGFLVVVGLVKLSLWVLR